VHLCSAPLSGNWLTFGLVRAGRVSFGPKGIGRSEEESWGIADDRGRTVATNAAVFACGRQLTGLPRKLREGDVLKGEVNVTAGWFEVSLNGTEFTHCFEIPQRGKDDYWFGVTLANNHQATIGTDSPEAMAARSTAAETTVRTRAPTPPVDPTNDDGETNDTPEPPPPTPQKPPKQDPTGAEPKQTTQQRPPAPPAEPAPKRAVPALDATSPPDLAVDSGDEDPVYVPPMSSGPKETAIEVFTSRKAAQDIKPFQARLFIVTQEAGQFPARRSWMTRRDELQRDYKAAKEVVPQDFQRIAAVGRMMEEHEMISSTLMLTEETCSTLPKRHSALVKELEELCDSLLTANNFDALEKFGALLTEAREIDLTL
jgi:hypothetical protein